MTADGQQTGKNAPCAAWRRGPVSVCVKKKRAGDPGRARAWLEPQLGESAVAGGDRGLAVEIELPGIAVELAL